MKKISLLMICCLAALMPLFGIELESKPGVAYLSGGEVCFCSLGQQQPLQLTATDHHVMAFALSPDKRYLAYSKMFKVVDEPGIFDSIVPQVPVCSIVMLDLKEQKIVREIFPEEYYWLEIDRWINAGQLVCELASGFSVDDWYLFNTTGRVDTLGEDGRENYLNGIEYQVADHSLTTHMIREDRGAIYLKYIVQNTDTLIFKESDHIHFKAIASDFKLFVWSETPGGTYYSINSCYSYHYLLHLKNIAANESRVLLEEKNSRERVSDEICFSPDNNVVSINWFRSDHFDLYFLKKNQLLTIEGQLVDWIDARRLVLVKDYHLYIYDTVDDKSVLWIKDVSKPQFVR